MKDKMTRRFDQFFLVEHSFVLVTKSNKILILGLLQIHRFDGSYAIVDK